MSKPTTAAPPVVRPAPLPDLLVRPPLVDPRSKLIALIVVNALVYGSAGQAESLVLAVVTAAALLATLPWRAGLGWLAAFAVMEILSFGVPLVWVGELPGLLAVLGYWGARMMVSIGLAVAVLASTQPAHLRAALAAWRVPGVVAVPLTVMVRFFPVAWAELGTIRDTMQIRGVDPGWVGWVRHPIRSAEYLLVPFLTSATRIADDLSASAVVRGLGAPNRPTSVVALRWGWVDAAILAGVVILIGWAAGGTVAGR